MSSNKQYNLLVNYDKYYRIFDIQHEKYSYKKYDGVIHSNYKHIVGATYDDEHHNIILNIDENHYNSRNRTLIPNKCWIENGRFYVAYNVEINYNCVNYELLEYISPKLCDYYDKHIEDYNIVLGYDASIDFFAREHKTNHIDPLDKIYKLYVNPAFYKFSQIIYTMYIAMSFFNNIKKPVLIPPRMYLNYEKIALDISSIHLVEYIKNSLIDFRKSSYELNLGDNIICSTTPSTIIEHQHLVNFCQSYVRHFF